MAQDVSAVIGLSATIVVKNEVVCEHQFSRTTDNLSTFHALRLAIMRAA